MMKKILCMAYVVSLLLALCSCRHSDNVLPEEKSVTADAAESAAVASEADTETKGGEDTMSYDFSVFKNVEISGINLADLDEEKLSVLYTQARYCQAMTDADTETLREIVSEDMTFTHMSGMVQSREEYFADIADGNLNYFTIGIDKPVIKVDGDSASITFTSVLNANAYGARGTFRMKGTHHYKKRDGEWIAVNE